MQRRLLLASFAAAALAGCAGMKRKDQGARLDDALRAYTEAVRWGNFEAASLFARPRAASPRAPDPATLSGLKVTGFSVRVDRVSEAADEAQVAIAFTYYHDDRGSIRNVEQRATWYWDEAREGWLMDGSLPEFRR